MNEAAKIWAEAIKETGLWLSPFADNVAELGRLIIPKMQQAIDAARAEQRERDARIAENACLVPPDGGSPTEDERLMCEYAAAAIRNQGDET